MDQNNTQQGTGNPYMDKLGGPNKDKQRADRNSSSALDNDVLREELGRANEALAISKASKEELEGFIANLQQQPLAQPEVISPEVQANRDMAMSPEDAMFLEDQYNQLLGQGYSEEEASMVVQDMVDNPQSARLVQEEAPTAMNY